MLEQITRMQFTLSHQIGLVRGLWCLVQAKIFSLHSYRDLSLPSISLAGDAKQARAAIRPSSSFLIVSIDRAISLAQIAPAIIGAMAIAVIHHLSRKSAKHMQKGKPMSGIILPSDMDELIALNANPSSHLASAARPTSLAIGKIAGFWIVIQAISQGVGIKIIHSLRFNRHDLRWQA